MRRWLALFLAVVLVFSLVACGGKKSSTEPGNTDDPPIDDPNGGGDDPPTDDPGAVDNFFDFSVEGTIYSALKELRYTFKGADDEEYTYTQVYLDSETIDYEMEGESHSDLAKHFRITIEEGLEANVYEAWINDEGVTVKAGQGGDFATGDSAAFYALGYAFYAIPFYIYNGAFAEMLVQNDFSAYGWTIKEQTSSSKDFGDGSVKVYNYRFSAVGEAEAFDWEVAVFKGQKVITRWKMKDNNEAAELIVERIIFF